MLSDAPSWLWTVVSGGAIVGPSAYFMKSPPTQYTDDEAREMVETFIAGKSE